jgi:hypothetical protein
VFVCVPKGKDPSIPADEMDGAPIAWNTGIAEVDLPIDFKLKNIEVRMCGGGT